MRAIARIHESRRDHERGQCQLGCRQEVDRKLHWVRGDCIRAERQSDNASAIQVRRQYQVDLIQPEEPGSLPGEFHGQVKAIARWIGRGRGDGCGIAESGAIDGEARTRVGSILWGLHQEWRGREGYGIEDRARSGAGGVRGKHTGCGGAQ